MDTRGRAAEVEEESAPLLSDAYASLTSDAPSPVKAYQGDNVQRGLVYLLFFVLGAITLLSWNSAIVASAYYGIRLADSRFQDSYMSYLTLVGSLSNLFFLYLANRSQQDSQPLTRIWTSIILITAVQVAFALTALTDSIGPNAFFALLLLLSLLGSMGTAYLQAAAIALSSYFSPYYLQAIFSGQGAIGVGISVVQFASSAGTSSTTSSPIDESIKRSAFIFFSIAALFTLSGLLLHLSLIRLPFYRRTVDQANHAHDHNATAHIPLWQVERKVRSLGIAAFAIFAITLAIFPSITSAILSVRYAPTGIYSPALYIPLGFIVFNAGDWLGRGMAAVPALGFFGVKRLCWATAARVIFIPLFLLCNVVTANRSSDFEPLINSDSAYLLLLLVFAVSNGYISTLIFMSGIQQPSLAPAEKELAGSILVFYLSIGLTAGSLLSFATRAMTCSCNPFVS